MAKSGEAVEPGAPDSAMESIADPAMAGPVGVVVGASPVRLWGMTSFERLRRAFLRAGLHEVRAWDGMADGRSHILARADHVYDEALIKGLVKARDTILLAPVSGLPVAAHVSAADAARMADMLERRAPLPADPAPPLRAVGPAELGSAYRGGLRKRETPYLLPLMPESLPTIEARMFAGSYKGVTDLVTKYVWPAPALQATRWCARREITPNVVTGASLLLVLLAMALFAGGLFLPGLVAAWLMTFLDTVDGKLARVTLTSTRFGGAFDHGIDLIHPPFWYWGWMLGLEAAGMVPPLPELVVLVVIGGYVAQRLQEGLFMALFGIEIHVWRRFDSRFRLITARRNPNLILLTLFTVAARPDLGIVAVAVWTALSLLVHTIRIAQALWAKRRQGRLDSWLAG